MKKVFLITKSLIALITITACSGTENLSDNPQESQTSEIIQPQPPIQEPTETIQPQPTTQDELPHDSAMPDPFEHQEGGDGHKNFVHWLNDKLMGIPVGFFDLYEEYVGEEEFISELWEWEQAREKGLTISYVTGIMDFQNFYSLAVINNIPIEFVVAAMEEYNEFRTEMAFTSFGIVAGKDDLPYSEEDKAVLLTQDEAAILAHFASPYAIVVEDKVYTPAWLYWHDTEAYEAAGITPEMIEEKLDLYAEFSFTAEAAEAFEAKLSEFMETDVVLDRASQ